MLLSGIVATYLSVLSVEDIKKRKVRMLLLYLGVGIVVGGLFLYRSPTIIERVVGGGIGLVFLLITWVTKGGIGLADGILVLYLGVLYGYLPCLTILLIASIACSICCMLMIGFRLVTRKARIPYIPFLLIGYLCYFIAGRNYV